MNKIISLKLGYARFMLFQKIKQSDRNGIKECSTSIHCSFVYTIVPWS